MTLQVYTVFDPVQEASDGRGWKLSYWDDAIPAQVAAGPTVELFHRLTNSARSVAAVTNKALTTNVVTLTTAAAHGFAVNQIVTVAIGDLVFDGTYTITVVGSGTTFSYARTNGNVGSVAATGTATAPVLAYTQSTVTNKALTTNVATITTGGPHGLLVGQYVTVSIGDAIFDGTYLIASVPTNSTFTYAKTHADVTTAVATGTVRTERSVVERIKELFAADTTTLAYFTSVAQAQVLAGNTATVATNLATLEAAEGLT